MTATSAEQVYRMVQAVLVTERAPTPETIRSRVEQIAGLFGLSGGDIEAIARRLEVSSGVRMGIGAMIDERDFRPWLAAAKTEGRIDPYYWNRYRSLLATEKGLSGDVLSALDDVTDRVLDRLGDPTEEGAFDRRGMVVGHVQSGKTANYLGLLCKAADAGYRLIIVIAGIHNNLRNQTQRRIDEGFIGRDTARLLMRGPGAKTERRIGVGLYDVTHTPVSLTTALRDFNKNTATTNVSSIASYSVPVILVIKKNASTLRNLTEWLTEHSTEISTDIIEHPMLLIDDEADNASINIRHGSGEVSRINGQIREILSIFRRSCYVGYTATPFANIFIDPDTYDDVLRQDLFPRHFILGLDAPDNYFGARRVFLDETDAVLRDIDDNEDLLPIRHRISHEVRELPPSLVTALRAFVLSRAIRNLRGQARAHASMLVNVSRFTGVQKKLRNRLHARLDTIAEAIRVSAGRGASALDDPEIAALQEIWAAEYATAWPDWASLQAALHEAVAAITVVEVNSNSPGSLSYDDKAPVGTTVIAVGGFSLSRGLTLEGLTISYFLRNSLMYDTLMQMGRWFGYRPDYEDLCRVWMPREAAGWYAHIAEAIEELGEELRRMQQANATPEEFGLKVRSHPASLIVTARNKMGSGEEHTVLISLSNRYIETARLLKEGAALRANREAVRGLVSALQAEGLRLQDAEQLTQGLFLRGASPAVVKAFIRRFRNADEASPETKAGPVVDYIERREADELREWDVLFTRVRDGEGRKPSDLLGVPITVAQRSAGQRFLQSGVLAISGASARIASRGVERAGVDETVAQDAESEFATKQGATGRPVNYPDRIYRQVRARPLLVVHLVRVKPVDGREVTDGEPVAAWGISFPPSARADEPVAYVVNARWLRDNFGEDGDEDEMAGDAD